MNPDPFIQTVDPMIVLGPQLPVVLDHGDFVDRKREEEVSMKMKEFDRILLRHSQQ